MSKANKKIQCFVLMRISSSTYIEYICHNCSKTTMNFSHRRASNRKWAALSLVSFHRLSMSNDVSLNRNEFDLCSFRCSVCWCDWPIFVLEPANVFETKDWNIFFHYSETISIESWLMSGNVNERERERKRNQMTASRRTTNFSRNRNGNRTSMHCRFLFCLEHERKWFERAIDRSAGRFSLA